MIDATDNNVSIYVAAAVAGGTILALLWLRRSRAQKDTPPQDTVILHQLRKGVHAPSISAFVLKLETYLKMAKIPYQNAFDGKMSSKGKTPWIEYNGHSVPDSALCIEYLNAKFGVNLDDTYKPVDLAIARAFVIMLEERTYWFVALYRCVYDKNGTIFRKLGLGNLIRTIIARKATSAAWYHGIGRHSEQEVTRFAEKDLEAVSLFIGDTKFLLGSHPCEQDCAIFGQLVQAVWQSPGSTLERLIDTKYPNLKEYCIRMKEKYWPDWNERVMENIL